MWSPASKPAARPSGLLGEDRVEHLNHESPLGPGQLPVGVELLLKPRGATTLASAPGGGFVLLPAPNCRRSQFAWDAVRDSDIRLGSCPCLPEHATTGSIFAGGQRMRADQALELTNHLLWTAMIVAAPLLIVSLVVGLIISVFQVATQLQEMTLTYVPKLLATAMVLVLLGGWMLSQVTGFAVSMIRLIPSLS